MNSARFEFEVSQAQIQTWAELSGDYNPIHVDRSFAEQTRFGGTIAHGHLTLAVVSDFCAEFFGPQWMRTGALSQVRFTSPVRPDRGYKLILDPAEGESPLWTVTVIDAVSGKPCVSAQGNSDWGYLRRKS